MPRGSSQNDEMWQIWSARLPRLYQTSPEITFHSKQVKGNTPFITDVDTVNTQALHLSKILCTKKSVPKVSDTWQNGAVTTGHLERYSLLRNNFNIYNIHIDVTVLNCVSYICNRDSGSTGQVNNVGWDFCWCLSPCLSCGPYASVVLAFPRLNTSKLVKARRFFTSPSQPSPFACWKAWAAERQCTMSERSKQSKASASLASATKLLTKTWWPPSHSELQWFDCWCHKCALLWFGWTSDLRACRKGSAFDESCHSTIWKSELLARSLVFWLRGGGTGTDLCQRLPRVLAEKVAMLNSLPEFTDKYWQGEPTCEMIWKGQSNNKNELGTGAASLWLQA